MPAATASLPDAFTAEYLDLLGGARTAEDGLRQVDEVRRRIAPASVFSIQQNVTTAQDPANEILLRRFWSSEAEHYPVNSTKRKLLTPWTRRVFVQGLPFVAEGADELARHFDDYEQMRPWGLRCVVNVPLLQGNTCYATFNVFGTRGWWLPHEVMGIRLLALAAARWVPAASALDYRFTAESLTVSLEA
jgi:hypothetical protein